MLPQLNNYGSRKLAMRKFQSARPGTNHYSIVPMLCTAGLVADM